MKDLTKEEIKILKHIQLLIRLNRVVEISIKKPDGCTDSIRF